MALYRTLLHDLVKNEIGEKRKMNQAKCWECNIVQKWGFVELKGDS